MAKNEFFLKRRIADQFRIKTYTVRIPFSRYLYLHCIGKSRHKVSEVYEAIANTPLFDFIAPSDDQRDMSSRVQWGSLAATDFGAVRQF